MRNETELKICLLGCCTIQSVPKWKSRTLYVWYCCLCNCLLFRRGCSKSPEIIFVYAWSHLGFARGSQLCDKLIFFSSRAACINPSLPLGEWLEPLPSGRLGPAFVLKSLSTSKIATGLICSVAARAGQNSNINLLALQYHLYCCCFELCHRSPFVCVYFFLIKQVTWPWCLSIFLMACLGWSYLETLHNRVVVV